MKLYLVKIFEAILGPVIALVVVTALAYLIRGLLYRWAKKRELELGAIIAQALRWPSFIWCIILGLYVSLAVSSLSPPLLGYGNKVLTALIILSVTLAGANILAQAFLFYARRRSVEIPATGLTRSIIKVIVLAVGITILLGHLGISITPVVTALGVGGLAVALALQDTLANLVSGIHILMEKSVRVGDYIKLDTGEEGYVDDIGWRTTRIRLPSNNQVILPNSKLAKSVITNYNMPEPATSLAIPISVSYDCDPDQVERVLVEEATKAIEEVAGLMAEPPPMVRLIPGFGDYSLNFTLSCWVKSFADQYPVQHELRKRIFKRFQKEGIVIPFPVRTVYLAQGGEKTPADNS